MPATKHKEDYVAVDACGVLYDMGGHPVWYIPDTNGFNGNVSDLEFTPDGTITFMNKNAYEINYNGGIIWKAPNKGIISGDTLRGETYHHEFTKLSNGHYMVLGIQILMCKAFSSHDSTYILTADPANSPEGYKKGKFGTIIEYDGKGNIVWSWKSSEHIIGSDYDYFHGIDTNQRFDPHENAFFFDENNKVIYLGFRNLNRIIKIEYPSGRIIGTYGENYKPGSHSLGADLFCNQHSINISQDGYLYYFNNNSCRLLNQLPTVVMLQEPISPSDSFKKIWEYTCTVDGIPPKTFGSGGNAKELPDRSLFINMGSDYSKLFILTRDKQVLWSALPERYEFPDSRWTPLREYRATIISRKDLERMIWAAETPNP